MAGSTRAEAVDVPVEGGHLRCWIAGSGRPVVLLHGFSFDHAMWAPQIDALGDSCLVVAYDLRGFGESSPPVAHRSHLDDLVELLDHVGIDRADVVGLSLGGNVALAAAAYEPARVSRIGLLSSGLPGHTWRGRPPEEAAEVARREGVEAARRFWLDHELLASARRNSRSARAVEEMVNAFPAHQWRSGIAGKPLPPVDPLLERVAAPALILSGEHDVDGYRQISSVLARRLPHARFVQIGGAGHVLTLESPGEVNAQLLSFLVTERGSEPDIGAGHPVGGSDETTRMT